MMSLKGLQIRYPYIPCVPTPIRNIAELIDRNILSHKRIVSRNNAFWKHNFYQAGKFDETINQMNVHDMIKEEEYGFGEKLSKLKNSIQNEYKLRTSGF